MRTHHVALVSDLIFSCRTWFCSFAETPLHLQTFITIRPWLRFRWNQLCWVRIETIFPLAPLILALHHIILVMAVIIHSFKKCRHGSRFLCHDRIFHKFKSNRFGYSFLSINPNPVILFANGSYQSWLSSSIISFNFWTFQIWAIQIWIHTFIWPYLAIRITFSIDSFAHEHLYQILADHILYNQNSNTFWPVLNSNWIQTSFRYNLCCSIPFQIILFANEFLCPIQSVKQQVCYFPKYFWHFPILSQT